MTDHPPSSVTERSAIDEPTEEQRADAAADLKAVLGVFLAAVAIAVAYISGWSPQF